MQKENRHFIYIPVVQRDPGKGVSFSACKGRTEDENLGSRSRQVEESKKILPYYRRTNYLNTQSLTNTLNSNNNSLSLTKLGENSTESTDVLQHRGRIVTGHSNDNFTHMTEKETELSMCGSPESGIECDDTSSVDMTVLRDEPLLSDSTEHDDREIGLIHASTYVEDKNEGADQVEEDNEMKILSVHSLASEESCITCPSRCILRDPLTKCRRLYIRRIKGSGCDPKNVLVLEADYNPALPYSSLKNTPDACGFTNVPKAIICAGIQSLKTRKGPKFIAEPKIVSEPLRKRRNEKSFTIKPLNKKGKPDHVDLPREKGTESFSAAHNIVSESFSAPNVHFLDNIDYNEEDTGRDAWRDFVLTAKFEESTNEDFARPKRKKPRGAKSTSPRRSKRVPVDQLSPQTNRISELKEKLKQKEADLENIRRNMSTLKSVEDL